MPLAVGTSATVETVVDQSNVASVLGSGTLEVFATPAMIAQMELAACRCLEGHLEAGQSSVGTVVAIQHTAATPVGMKVRATATVTAVDGRKIDFEVSASDEAGPIGSGTHTRFVVDAARFMAKAAAKAQGKG